MNNDINDYDSFLDYFNKKILESTSIPYYMFDHDPLDDIEFSVIEKYLRRKKIESINKLINNE